MKTVFKTIFALIMSYGLNSCNPQNVQTVFQSTEVDKATEPDETKIYILKKHTTNSDFNYSKLNEIDDHKIDTLNMRNLIPVFEPVSGRFNYFQFIATFKGEGYYFGEAPIIKDFHDILIVKADSDNNILDSYHYTMEWAEPPLQYDLYKGSVTNIRLSDSLEISKLKLLRTHSWNKEDIELKDNGIIILK